MRLQLGKCAWLTAKQGRNDNREVVIEGMPVPRENSLCVIGTVLEGVKNPAGPAVRHRLRKAWCAWHAMQVLSGHFGGGRQLGGAGGIARSIAAPGDRRASRGVAVGRGASSSEPLPEHRASRGVAVRLGVPKRVAHRGLCTRGRRRNSGSPPFLGTGARNGYTRFLSDDRWRTNCPPFGRGGGGGERLGEEATCNGGSRR